MRLENRDRQTDLIFVQVAHRKPARLLQAVQPGSEGQHEEIDRSLVEQPNYVVAVRKLVAPDLSFHLRELDIHRLGGAAEQIGQTFLRRATRRMPVDPETVGERVAYTRTAGASSR